MQNVECKVQSASGEVCGANRGGIFFPPGGRENRGNRGNSVTNSILPGFCDFGSVTCERRWRNTVTSFGWKFSPGAGLE